jgi:hypothetical protein
VIHPSFYVEEMAWVLYACHTILCYKSVTASRSRHEKRSKLGTDSGKLEQYRGR